VGFLRRHWLLSAILLLFIGVLAVLGVTATAVWKTAHTDEASRVDHADVILVLGAAQYNGRPSPVFESRLRHAANLYGQSFSGSIVVLGASQQGDVTTEAEAGKNWLLTNGGLPETSVFAEAKGNTTLESLEAAADFMRRHDFRTAFLVSDPWHNLRIRRMARDLGIDAFVSATGASAARTHGTRFSGYARETVGYLYYRVFHR
jgi:vancomycin permeability regulator SanA